MATTTTTGTLSPIVMTYYEKRAFDRCIKNYYLHDLGMKRNIPRNSGTTISFYRYSNIAGTTSTIAEGTTSGEVQLVAQAGTLSLAQYGQYVTLSDLVTLSTRTPVMNETVDILGLAAAETVDLNIRTELHNNATPYVVNGKTAGGGGTLLATDTMDSVNIRKLARNFAVNAVRTFSDGDSYVGVFHPYATYDIRSDTANGGFIEASKYNNQNKLYKGEIGKIWNMRILESSNMQTVVAPGGVTAYEGFVLGENAFVNTELDGSNLQLIVKPLGSSGTADPMNQRATVAYKMTYGVKYVGSTTFSNDQPRCYAVTSATNTN